MTGRYGTAERFCGQVWGNGEFGLSVQRKFRISVPLQSEGGEDRTWSIQRPVVPWLPETSDCPQKREMETHEVRLASKSRAPLEISESTRKVLGLSNVVNSHTRKARGSKGITRYGSQLVKNAGDYLERNFSRKRLAFLTVTIPPLTTQQFDELLDGWAEIVRVFCQWLRRRLRKAFLPGHLVGCSEVQESRFASTGLPYPHLHLVYVGRQSRGNWSIGFVEIRAAWLRAVNTRLTHPLKPQDVKACEKVVEVEKSVSDYLGKYLSKGIQAMTAVTQCLKRQKYLSAYYTISKVLRERVLRERYRGTGAVMNFLAELCESSQEDVFKWVKKIHITLDGVPVPWGWAGKLTKFGQECLKDFMRVH